MRVQLTPTIKACTSALQNAKFAAMTETPAKKERVVRKSTPRRGFFARNWFLLLIFLPALAAAGGAYYYYNYASVASAEVALVKRGSALASIYGTVNVVPADEVIVRTRNFGQLSSWKVHVGDQVKKGQVLAEMTDDTLLHQLDNAEQNLKQAQARQALGPSSAQALKNAQIEVDNVKKLLDAGGIAPVEYEKAQHELQSLQEQVQNETMSLNNDVDSSQRIRDALGEQLKEMELTAPLDGIVLNSYVNLGEFIPPQTQLCRIGSAANTIIANVNEEDVGYLKPGMKAQIRLYAFPDKNLPATLSFIQPQADNQVYKVSFGLDDPSQNLLPGMTGEMNVIVGERKNTLTIPSRAIRHGDTVLSVVNGVVVENHIHVGFHTIETSEVVDGLSEGTPVILSNQDLYKPGMRVRQLTAKDN